LTPSVGSPHQRTRNSVARALAAAALLATQACAWAGQARSALASASRPASSIDRIDGEARLSTRNDFAGFADRCAHPGSVCFTAEALATSPSARLSDFLVRANGVVRRCTNDQRTMASTCALFMRSAAGPGQCAPSYYIDGQAFRAPSETAISDLDLLLSPSDVRGIEVHRGEAMTFVPGAWVDARHDPDCGAIVVWTRN
jgi:hypothetical protein